MANFWTNRGKRRFLEIALMGTSVPTNFKLVLCTGAITPTNQINTINELTEIATGNGYTAGGKDVPRSSSGFENMIELDTPDDNARIELVDAVFNASGGPIPASGSGARWACLCDAVTPNANVLIVFDLEEDKSVSSGQSLTIRDAKIGLN
jgi:hypothetical protein